MNKNYHLHGSCLRWQGKKARQSRTKSRTEKVRQLTKGGAVPLLPLFIKAAQRQVRDKRKPEIRDPFEKAGFYSGNLPFFMAL